MIEGGSAHNEAQNTAILSRLKDLLNQQIAHFHNYLTALEKQKAAIESGRGQDILAYIEIEEQIASDIFAIQKVIDPLKPAAEPEDIAACKATLEDLKNRAVAQFENNSNLLAARMTEVGAEIAALRNNPLAAIARRSLLSNTASLVDIEG